MTGITTGADRTNVIFVLAENNEKKADELLIAGVIKKKEIPAQLKQKYAGPTKVRQHRYPLVAQE